MEVLASVAVSLEEKCKQLRMQKKRKKMIDEMIPENRCLEGDLGGDASNGQIELEPEKPVRRKRRKSKAKKEETEIPEKPNPAGLNNIIESVTVETAKPLKNKQNLKRATDNMSTRPSQLDHGSLDEWVNSYYFTKTKTIPEAHREVMVDITRSIDNTRVSSSENHSSYNPVDVKLPENESKAKPVAIRKPATKRQKPNTGGASNVNPEAEKEAKDKFFLDNNNDLMPGDFEQRPSRYEQYMKLIEEEEKRKDELYRNDARACIDDTKAVNLDDPPEVTRSYVARFLRESRGEKYDERECARGNMCIFNILGTNYPQSIEDSTPDDSFICREFLTPVQQKLYDERTELPLKRQYCYGDNVLVTNYIYEKHMKENSEPEEVIQNFKVCVNHANGYALRDCIEPVKANGKFTGFSGPFPKFLPQRWVSSKIPDPDNPDIKLKGVVEQNMDFFCLASTATKTL